jgi:transcriptional regulator with XRE-family HTH domain
MFPRLGDLAARGVRAERSRRGWRQAELATRLGTSQTTISQIESGRRRLSLDDLLAMCTALQVPLEQLLVGAQAEQLQALGLRRRPGGPAR